MTTEKQKAYLNNNAETKFSIGFRWNLYGSTIFEALKIIHNAFLLYILSPVEFGKMGLIFSITYATIYFSDFAATTALPPFINDMTESKNNFKKLFSFYFLPQIPLLVFAGLFLSLLYSKFFLNPIDPSFLFFIFLLIFFEGIRIFFRAFFYYFFYC